MREGKIGTTVYKYTRTGPGEHVLTTVGADGARTRRWTFRGNLIDASRIDRKVPVREGEIITHQYDAPVTDEGTGVHTKWDNTTKRDGNPALRRNTMRPRAAAKAMSTPDPRLAAEAALWPTVK